MAGTTVDEDNVVYKTVCQSLIAHGVEKVNLDLVLEIGAGKEKLKAIEDVLKHLHLENAIDALEVHHTFKSSLTEAYRQLPVKPVAGTLEIFAKLRQQGVLVVLNTGYTQDIATTLITKLKWQQGVHFDALITADDVVNGRPQPDMIIKAMQHFDINDPSDVLKIGDSAIDIEEGINANCGITIGVLSGAQNRDQLQQAKPDYILDSVASLDEVIEL